MPECKCSLARLELWDNIECDGGTRLGFVTSIIAATEKEELNGDEKLELEVYRSDLTAQFDHDIVIRTVDSEDNYDEWRIRKIREGHDTEGRETVRLTCESIRFDLINNAEILERAEVDGSANSHFEYYGLTPEQHIDVILSYADDYFVKGTIEPTDPVDMIYHDDSPLSALMELATITNTELEVVRDGSFGYRINLVEQIGAGFDTLEIRHGSNLLSGDRETDSADMGTRVYVRGGQTFGREGTLAGASWEVAVQSGGTIQFVDEIMLENDQLNGYYVIDKDGFARQITDSVAPSTIVTATTVSLPDNRRLSFKRQYTDPVTGTIIYVDLTYLELPSAVAQYGIKPSLLERSDIPGVNNYVVNPLLSEWEDVNTVKGFTKLGNATFQKNTSPLYTRHGGASAYIRAVAGDGIVTENIRIVPTEANPFLAAQAQLFVADNGIVGVPNGHVRMEIEELVTGLIFPPPNQPAETLTEGAWIDSFGVNPGAEPDDNWYTRMVEAGATSLVFRVRLICAGDPNDANAPVAAFYLDALQLTRTPSFTEEIYGGFASNDLWKLGLRALETLTTPAQEYNVDIIDLHRLDPDTYTFNEIVLGGAVRIVDNDVGIDFTTRILSVDRNLLVEGETKLSVEGKSNDLSRLLGGTSRRTRAPVDTAEGGDANLPPSSTENLGGGLNCPEAAAEYCSPDSSGAYDIYEYTAIDLEENSIAIGSDIAWGYEGKVTPTGPDGGEANPEGTMSRTTVGAVFYQDGYDRNNLDISNFTARVGTWTVETVTSPDGKTFKVLTCDDAANSLVEANMTAIGDMYVFYRIHWEPAWQNESCAQQDAQGDQLGPIARFEYDAVQGVNYGYYLQRIFSPATALPCGVQRTDEERELFKAVAGTDTSLVGPATWNHGQTLSTTYGCLVALDGDVRAVGPGGITGSSSDSALSGRTGVAAFGMIQPYNRYNGLSAISVVTDLDIVCSGLPTGYYFGISAANSVQESGGTATFTFPETLYVPWTTVYVWDGNPLLNGNVASTTHVFADSTIGDTDSESSTVQATNAPSPDDTYTVAYNAEIANANNKSGTWSFTIELQVNIDGGGFQTVASHTRSGTIAALGDANARGTLEGVIAGVDTDDTWKVVLTAWSLSLAGATLDIYLGPLSYDYQTTVITEMARFSPSTGVFPGDVYVYDSTGSQTDSSPEAIFAAVDLQFYNSTPTLISQTSDDGVKTTAYSRGTNTTVIPANTATIVPIARRKGGGAGIACVKQLVVNLGVEAAVFKPCDVEGAPTGTAITLYCAPSSKDLVLHLPMDDEKYPICPVAEYASFEEYKRPDPDGTIDLSGTFWDSSRLENHHKVMFWVEYDYGPQIPNQYDEQPPRQGANPLGDYVYDVGRFVDGVAGSGWEIFSYAHPLPFAGSKTFIGESAGKFVQKGAYNDWENYQTGNVDEDGWHGAFDKMDEFTYTFWFRPAWQGTGDTYHTYYLLGCYEDASFVGYDYEGFDGDGSYKTDTIGATLSQWGGWQLYYYWDQGTEFGFGFTYVPHNRGTAYESLWATDAIGDTFMDLLSAGPEQEGIPADDWSFIALRVKQKEGSTHETTTFDYEEGGGSYKQFASDTAEWYAFPFTPTETIWVQEVSFQAAKLDDIFTGAARIDVEIRPDNGGNPDTYANRLLDGKFPSQWVPLTTDPVEYRTASVRARTSAVESKLTASTQYWLVFRVANTATDLPSNTIRLLGTDPGTGAGKSSTDNTNWSAISFRAHFSLSGFTDGTGNNKCDLDFFLGRTGTGQFEKLYEYENIYLPWIDDEIGGDGTNTISRIKNHGRWTNSGPHTVAGWSEGPINTFKGYQYAWSSGSGVWDEVKRWNRALSDAEIEGAFRAGASNHPTKRTTQSLYADVEKTTSAEAATRIDVAGVVPVGSIIAWHKSIRLINLTNASYQWTASGGTNTYYVEASGGGDPSIPSPRELLADDIRLVVGGGGTNALNDLEWDYDDNNSLGYNTIYFRDDTNGDPDTSGVKIDALYVDEIPANFVECNGQTLSDPLSPLDGATIPDLNAGTYLKGGEPSGVESTEEAASGSAVVPNATVVWIMRVR